MFGELTLLTKLAIALAMLIFLPRLMERLRLPAVLGFILAGVILGPGLLGMLRPDSESIQLWSELGKLLFMFFVGFEIDLEQFNRARGKAAVFGALTFAFPFVAAMILGLALGYGATAAVLIGSVVASHTLLAYPILQRCGLLDRESILVSIGGTIFTDIAAMLVLAIAVSVHQFGFSWAFLATRLVELGIYVPVVLFGLSKVARKLIIWFGDTPEARVVILLMLLSVAAQLAELIQLESIVGAFLVGIAVKRALRSKFAVEQLEVLANALFIPTFFVATGFLIDFALLEKTIVSRPTLVFGLVGALLSGKFLAAWLTSCIFAFSNQDTKVVFSLTIPQMAATLASAVVGYETKDSNGVRLLDAEFVNAALALVVVTCIIGPILTKRWAGQISQVTQTQTPRTAGD